VPFTAGLHLEHWDKVDTSGAMDDGCRAGCISSLTRYTHFNSAPRHRARSMHKANRRQSAPSVCVCFIMRRGLPLIIFALGASPRAAFLSRRTPPPTCQRILRYECIMLRTQICIQQKYACSQISQRFLPNFSLSAVNREKL
jgi:hypothetical protein